MVIVVGTHPIEIIPPVLSFFQIVKSKGEDVAYVGLTYTEKSVKCLRESCIPFRHMTRWPCVKLVEHPVRRIWNWVKEKFGWQYSVMAYEVRRREFLWKGIRDLSHGDTHDMIIVSLNMTTVALLGDLALKFGKRHIHWALELGDENGIGWDGFEVCSFRQTATFVVSEINRARILMETWHLPKMPFILPNKSCGHPRMRCLPVSDPRAAKVVERWKGKKVFLYQGSLCADRNGIFEVLSWLCEAFPDCIVAVMTGMVSPLIKVLSEKYSNFVKVPYVVAPHHLEVTSHATVGIAVYSVQKVGELSPLNALYCAPNKTFEYSGFGIPLLCNDVPGLVETVGTAGAAECVALERSAMIKAAHRILYDYERFSECAISFFESVDEGKIINEILSFARS